MKRITVYEETAKEVVVEVEGLNAYKDAFLAIFNNVRTDNRLYGVENDSGNKIYVTCPEEEVESVKEWLSGFGEIKQVNTVRVLMAEEPDYDFDKYDDVKILFE